MLDSKTKQKIQEYVYKRPRTVQEIALTIGKNWRTANRYVEKISEESGVIAIKVFREGTRGSLKICYWNSIEKLHGSQAQERLFKQIETGRVKQEFSPFDIYQHICDSKRHAFWEYRSDKTKSYKQNIIGFLSGTQKQLLHFSGNLSWVNMSENNKKLIDVAEELARNKVSIKVVSRVELPGLNNIKTLCAINERVGYDAIEIRHCEQPLRGFIIDDKAARFREEKDLKLYEPDELKGDLAIFYEILDEAWISWLQKVFWHLFRTGMPAKQRIRDLESIQPSQQIG